MANTLLLNRKISRDLQDPKTIGEDYTEERLKNALQKYRLLKPLPSKRIGNVIDMNTNVKVKRKQRL